MSNDMMTPELVRLGVTIDGDKHAAIAKMAEVIAAARALLEFALRFSDSAGSAAVPTVVMIDDVPRTAPPGFLGAGSENDEQEGGVNE